MGFSSGASHLDYIIQQLNEIHLEHSRSAHWQAGLIAWGEGTPKAGDLRLILKSSFLVEEKALSFKIQQERMSITS